jgi:hypothetical protein
MRCFKMLHGMSICGATMETEGDLRVYKDVEPTRIAKLSNDDENRPTDVLACIHG